MSSSKVLDKSHPKAASTVDVVCITKQMKMSRQGGARNIGMGRVAPSTRADSSFTSHVVAGAHSAILIFARVCLLGQYNIKSLDLCCDQLRKTFLMCTEQQNVSDSPIQMPCPSGIISSRSLQGNTSCSFQALTLVFSFQLMHVTNIAHKGRRISKQE